MQWQGKTKGIRMKPDWLNDNSAANEPATAEGNYVRRNTVLYYNLLDSRAETNCIAPAISTEKNVSRIRQSFMLNSYCKCKWGLPKLGCCKAMNIGSEYPIRQRSFHSSPREVITLTWRRETVNDFNINLRNT